MNSREQLARIYLDMRPGAAAHVLETLPPEESAALLAELPARMSGPVLAAMLYHYAARCLNYLPADYIVLAHSVPCITTHPDHNKSPYE